MGYIDDSVAVAPYFFGKKQKLVKNIFFVSYIWEKSLYAENKAWTERKRLGQLFSQLLLEESDFTHEKDTYST